MPVCLTCEFMQLYYSIVCFYFCFVCILLLKLQQSVLYQSCIFFFCLMHSISFIIAKILRWIQELVYHPAATAKHNRRHGRTHTAHLTLVYLSCIGLECRLFQSESIELMFALSSARSRMNSVGKYHSLGR